jgi:hypothetical protein
MDPAFTPLPHHDFMLQTGSIAAAGGDWKQVNYNAGGFPSSGDVSVLSHVQTYRCVAHQPGQPQLPAADGPL